MSKLFQCIILVVFIFTIQMNALPLFAASRGLTVVSKEGKSIDLYKDYHAVVIGVSDYDDWPDLPNAAKDAQEVRTQLEKMGFTVSLVLDPDAQKLNSILTHAHCDLGREKERALLIYFAGHGATTELADGTSMGYIIPKDCPLQDRNPAEFENKAISMMDIEKIALQIKSRHVLMVFDSCFSGSLFNMVRAVPRDITEKSAEPVRQFITAGKENEEVPDKSVFKECFLYALGGDADGNKDGYITGTELGLYLESNVFNYSKGAQHPQYRKINNPKLDKGDFIFLAGGKIQWEMPAPKAKDGRVHITSVPASGKLYIDGAYSGETPQEISLTPGTHEIVVEKHGYKTQRETVQIRAGKDINLKILLEAVGGSIAVKSNPSPANVYLDGKLIGETPDTITDLKPLRYNIAVKKEGYKDWSKTVELGTGEVVAITAELVKVQQEVKAPKAGDTWKDPVTGMEFVWVPGGSFEMGDLFGDGAEDEKHIRTVRLDGFWLGKCEVTNNEFKQFIDETGYETTAEKEGTGGGISNYGEADWAYMKGINWRHPIYPADEIKDKMDHPVVQVSWDDAQAFVKWLSNKTGKKYHLPSEAEWEYAARSGGKKVKYAWGDKDPYVNGKKAGNIADESFKKVYGNATIWEGYDDVYVYTSPVGEYAPNDIGLYDMSGNVWEWCEDVYIDDYSKVGTDKPIYKGSGSRRVNRGGSWRGTPMNLRASFRDDLTPAYGSRDLGFRLARTP